MNRHPDIDTFRLVGPLVAEVVSDAGKTREMALQILPMRRPLTDKLAIAADLMRLGWSSTEIDQHIDDAIEGARAMLRQAT